MLYNTLFSLAGNALYNTDKAFSDWIDKVIKTHFGNYDISMVRELRTDDKFYRDHSHLFRYVDWIYNYGNVVISVKSKYIYIYIYI